MSKQHFAIRLAAVFVLLAPVAMEGQSTSGRLRRTGDYVFMLGQMIGSTAVRLLREEIRPSGTAGIWAGQQHFTCPGRERWMRRILLAKTCFPVVRTVRM